MVSELFNSLTSLLRIVTLSFESDKMTFFFVSLSILQGFVPQEHSARIGTVQQESDQLVTGAGPLEQLGL